jgi:hypothetical protein
MTSLATIVSIGAALALVATCLWLGRGIGALQERLERLEHRTAAIPDPPAPAHAGGRAPPRSSCWPRC